MSLYMCIYASCRHTYMNLYVWMDVDRHVSMYTWMNGYGQNYMNICMHACTHIYIHTSVQIECNSWQYVFQSKNT